MYTSLDRTVVDEEVLRKAIEDFYLPRNLVRAIYDIGQIPAHSTETNVGIGFIDIADYTYLSKFLSPKENQIILNGLYTAFQMVLERHGGYLNKIEGDSMMFHFDGIISNQFRSYTQAEQLKVIAKELFFTCVEMQRVCGLFNQASDRFVDANATEEARKALQSAFDIINDLRNKSDASTALHAFFQIRIRIGANLGEVTIGNFGPDGAKQWDVIGLPVINAKRMESTAPIGGLRISEEFFQILDGAGVVDAYIDRFRREALALGSVYRNIKKDELFAFREVVLREKKSASFRTYSVQVSPGLPESICSQIETLLKHGEIGINRILEILQYYRGNGYVINLIEKLFDKLSIRVRKKDLLGFLQPKALQELARDGTSSREIESLIEDKFNLYGLFQLMDEFQDSVQKNIITDRVENFSGYDKTMSEQFKLLREAYEKRKYIMVQRTYFFEVVYPSVFLSIKNSLLEYQASLDDPEELEQLEEA